MEPQNILPTQNRWVIFLREKMYFLVAVGLFIFLWFTYFVALKAPSSFEPNKIVSIEPGDNLREVSLRFKQENIIKSRAVFEAFVILYGGDRHIITADYMFEKPIPVYEVARRISKGERNIAPIKITIPEGFTNTEIATLAEAKLSNFERSQFLSLSEEGYLFPDTYFFYSDIFTETFVSTLKDNFNKKIKELDSDIRKSGKSLRDILTMASIIEGEAKGDNDRVAISSILWKRISIGMPLQADAAPITYKERGLPKSPINNPGLSSIKAAMFPVSTPYLYYIHDKDGKIHYARTYAEHRRNISNYLK